MLLTSCETLQAQILETKKKQCLLFLYCCTPHLQLFAQGPKLRSPPDGGETFQEHAYGIPVASARWQQSCCSSKTGTPTTSFHVQHAVQVYVGLTSATSVLQRYIAVHATQGGLHLTTSSCTNQCQQDFSTPLDFTTTFTSSAIMFLSCDH